MDPNEYTVLHEALQAWRERYFTLRLLKKQPVPAMNEWRMRHHAEFLSTHRLPTLMMEAVR